ncbi:MAG: hypothetical protein ACTSVY_06150, partial [Candidatus Helarchaeota archaeon]
MNVRILLSECHNEIINSENTVRLQSMLNGIDCIVFPLIEYPISYENIQDDDILIIGCPQTKFTMQEFDDIERFVLNGKYLFLISGNLGDSFYNTNLSELARRFDLEFNEDQIEDLEDNLESPSVIRVSDFERMIFSNSIKNLIYSGCSINILNDSCKIMAKTSSNTIPSTATIAAASANGRVFAIGGFNLFIDNSSIGIETANNFEFVLNIFDHVIKQIQFEREKEENEEVQIKIDEKIITKEDIGRVELNFKIERMENDYEYKIHKILNGDISNIPPKKAKDKFETIINMFIEYLNRLETSIDDFWMYLKDKLSKHEEKIKEEANLLLEEKYNEFIDEVNRISNRVNDQHVEFSSFFEEKYFNPEETLI